MKNTIRASLLAVGVMLFGTAAYAQGDDDRSNTPLRHRAID